jgi:hypothetical protein
VVGRDKTIVPPSDVEHFAQLGCSDREIAKYFGVHENTLRYNFEEYLTKGRHQLKITLRQAQLRAAIENLNPALLIWLGRNVLQQNENGVMNDEVRPLPWTDDMDDNAVEDVEDSIEESGDAE